MVETRLIDGKAFAEQMRGRLAGDVAAFIARTGVTPGLAVVLVGTDPASTVYVRNKNKQTLEAGMASIEHALPAETTEAALLALIDALNANPDVHGILVQLPLPGRRRCSPPSTPPRMSTASMW